MYFFGVKLSRFMFEPDMLQFPVTNGQVLGSCSQFFSVSNGFEVRIRSLFEKAERLVLIIDV